MIARLAQLLVLVSIGWLIARLIRRTGTREAPRQGSVASRGRMVRDRVCNTFVPDGRALIERVDGEAHYFCSERCRSSFLRESAANAHPSANPPPPGC